MSRHWPAAVISTALMAYCASAHAANSESTASISQIQYQLIDLDLNDGITPALTFTHFYAHQRLVGFEERSDVEELDTSGDLSFSASYGAATTTANVDTVASRAQIRSSTPSTHLFTTVDTTQEFKLTPNTGLSWSAVATISATHDAGAYAHAKYYVEGRLINGSQNLSEADIFLTNATTELGSDSVNLFGYLASMDQVVDGRVQIWLDLYTNIDRAEIAPPASPVPEPATYAMFAAGLLALGARASRKRT